jgi:N-acetyl-anhydromuramoyl-L-alanine amidase
MYVNQQSGLLEGAHFIASPNCDDRPADSAIEVLVVHAISLPPGEFGGPGVLQLFTNQLDFSAHPFYTEIAELKVSAHVFIRRDGEAIQFVPFHQRAWHAGTSCCEGREQVNDFSVGIELEGTDEAPFERIQYDRLVAVTQALMRAYPAITPGRVYGHADISPGRKTDPGPQFDWVAFRTQLEAHA